LLSEGRRRSRKGSSLPAEENRCPGEERSLPPRENSLPRNDKGIYSKPLE
jgi:hypothetical protein